MASELIISDIQIKDVNVASIENFVELFVKSYLSPCTKIAYAKDIEQFIAFCKEHQWHFKHPNEIRSSHFREYRDYLLNNLQLENNSIIRKMVSIRALMRWCCHEGIIGRNPLLNIQLPKCKQISTTQAFTDEEVKRILGIVKADTKHGSLHYAVLVMLFYLGLRKSELVCIKIKDFVEERNHHALIIHGKGDKYRKVPITPFIQNAIEKYKFVSGKLFQADSYLFQPIRNNYSRHIDKPLHVETLTWIITHYTRKASINKKVSPHSCRATVVSHLLDNKIPIRDVAAFVGHSSIQTTAIYDKRKDDLDNSAAYKVSY